MTKGKSTCKLLKDIRQQIADANGISYQPKECHYEGDCAGTCPACEAEIRYLEAQLRERKRKGWGMKVAGLAAGLCVATVPLTSCQNTPKACNVENKAQDSTDMPVMGEKVVIPKALTADLKNAIVIIGRVLDSSTGKAAPEVNVMLLGGKKRLSLGEDGRFALQVNRNDSLVFSSYGFEDKVIAVKSIRNPDDMVVRLEPSLDVVGEIDRAYLEKELADSTAPFIAINRHRLTTDGEGVTTLVGFHGCPLHCEYCLNPQCLQSDGVWRRMTPGELYSEVEIDDLYFMATGGGICFGGGEPLLHSDFIKAFAEIMNPEWKLTIETSLNVPLKNVKAIASLVQMWYVDIKDVNPIIYKAYTGESNERVMRNLQWLADNDYSDKIIIRLPLIPKYNTEENREHSQQLLKNIGFNYFDTFTYIVR